MPNILKTIINIAVGGALGAVLRYLTSISVYSIVGKGFPYGTLVVNVLGSFLMGLLTILLLDRITETQQIRAFLLVGFLGAYTTFSTFSIETMNQIEQGHIGLALLNILLNVVICITAVWGGMIIGRTI